MQQATVNAFKGGFDSAATEVRQLAIGISCSLVFTSFDQLIEGSSCPIAFFANFIICTFNCCMVLL